MELKTALEQLSKRLKGIKENIQTEEATKTAFVLPFLQILGYDIFNPMEVMPEYTADVGIKKGEKVDYAILQNGQPILIIECKHWRASLEQHDSQLHRYFHVSKARFALLTNGIQYRFFTDLEQSNVMDRLPFFECSLDDLREPTIQELRKFHRENFDEEQIVSSASRLKYLTALEDVIKQQIQSPSHDMTRLLASSVYNGRMTEKVLASFSEMVKKALQQTISDIVNDRLKAALEKETENQEEEQQLPEEEPRIVTTEEEIEGYHMVKSLLRDLCAPERIVHRDTQSYMGILLDDNNRKPICRLWFNGTTKYLGVFDEEKRESRLMLEDLNGIYEHAAALRQRMENYLKSE